MITIDGSYGEGGGQVLRTALALSTLTGQPVRIEHIRANRPKPGLRPQHLTAVRAAATICQARVTGDALGSSALTFVPGRSAQAGRYTFDVSDAAQGGSAGSVGLVLQTVLLPLALADGDSHLVLRGGTHVSWAPSAFYLEHVFLPFLSEVGVSAHITVSRWGFYPAGGGEIEVRIAGKSTLAAVQGTERGALRRIWGLAAVTNLPAHIPQRMAARAGRYLAAADLSAQIEPRRLRGAGPGAGIFLLAEYEGSRAGFTAYGRKGLPAERVAEAVCEELLAHHRSGAPCDPHLADQAVLPLALASGPARVVTSRVTLHLTTNVWVVRQFLDREIGVEGEPGAVGAFYVL